MFELHAVTNGGSGSRRVPDTGVVTCTRMDPPAASGKFDDRAHVRLSDHGLRTVAEGSSCTVDQPVVVALPVRGGPSPAALNGVTSISYV